MPRTYSQEGIVISETFRDRMDLHVWLEDIVNSHKSGLVSIWKILKEAGKYFGNPLKEYPKSIHLPKKVERGCCHQNNLLYAQIIFENHKDILGDFRFATGLWLRKAKNINPFSNANYCIGPHSFLLYQGNVLDCGALTHPPDFYEISQYFGISLEIQHAIDAYDSLQKIGVDSDNMPIIEVLTLSCSF